MKQSAQAQRSRSSLGAKLGYATGDILGGGAFSLISLLFLNFLVSYEGIGAGLAGTIVMLGKIWDAVTDPMMGVLSDRTRSRFGRRRIWILAGVLPVIFTFAMLWYSFGIQSTMGKVVYYVFAYMLFSTAFTIVMTPYNALLPDMVEDYNTRAGFSTIRLLISNLSALISVTLPSVLLGGETVRTQADYLRMGLIFGCFFGLPLLITFFTTWELPHPVTESGGFRSLLRQFRNSFSNRAYRQYLGIFVFGQMATDVCTTLMAFWLVDILRRTGLVTLVSGITMVVGVAVLPLNNWMAKKYGKQIPAVIDQPVRLIALAVAFFMGAESPFALLLLVSVLNGIGGSASSFVPWTLLPDLPDSDEMITGGRNAGLYAGVSTFVRKFTSGFAIFVVGLILQGFGYVETTAGQAVAQTETALLGVRVLFCVLPFLLTALTIWLAARYTLTKENHAKMRAAVACRRETGRATRDPALISACETIAGRSFETMWVGRDALPTEQEARADEH